MHDDLVRITSANCGSWSQTFNYTADTTNAFGNLNKNGSSQFQATYSYLTNRMTGIGGLTPSYDANGNVLNDFLHQYAWDAAGRPVTIDGVGITYDALGRMVEQNHSGAYTQVVYAPTGGKLALMSGTTLNKAFVPLAGGSTAVYNSSGLAYYRHSDWLGSSRLASTPSRGVYFDTAYGPFGEAYASTGTSDLSFTGMNQDTVANLYDFPAREYGIQGRWPSPDPAGLAAVDLTDPQTLNRYAYVRNSPLQMVDPSGLDPCEDGGDCGGGGGGCPECGPPIDPGGIDGPGPHQNLFGNSVYVFPPIGLPGQPVPGTTPSTFPTGPGIDWTSILFGPPNPALLIFDGFCSDAKGHLIDCVVGTIKDKVLDFLAANANYLPGVCTAGTFGFGTGGPGNAKGGLEGGILVDKQVGKPTTVQPIGEGSYGPVGVGVTPSEALVFVQPLPKVPAGAVFAADWHNGFINNSGISIGLFAGKFGHDKGLAGGIGGGAYLTFSSAANCLKNF